MTQINKNWKKILPGLLVSSVALVVVFYLVDAQQFIQALRLADYRLVALVFLITLCWLLVRTIFWRTLLQEKATVSQVFFTINEGYLLNNVLPLRLGEIGRSYLLARKANLQFMQVFSTILIERAIDIAMAAGLLFITLPFVIGADWARQAAIGAAVLVLGGLVGLYLLARYRETVIRLFEKSTGRWSVLQKFGSQQATAFLAGLAVLTDGKRFLRATGWGIVNWLISIVQSYFIIWAFFPEVKLLWAAFSLGVVALGAAAPSSPGAVGVFELSMVGALSAFNLDPSVALAAALTSHLTNYVITGALGSYALVRDGLSLTGLFRDVQQLEETP